MLFQGQSLRLLFHPLQIFHTFMHIPPSTAFHPDIPLTSMLGSNGHILGRRLHPLTLGSLNCTQILKNPVSFIKLMKILAKRRKIPKYFLNLDNVALNPLRNAPDPLLTVFLPPHTPSSIQKETTRFFPRNYFDKSTLNQIQNTLIKKTN